MPPCCASACVNVRLARATPPRPTRRCLRRKKGRSSLCCRMNFHRRSTCSRCQAHPVQVPCRRQTGGPCCRAWRRASRGPTRLGRAPSGLWQATQANPSAGCRERHDDPHRERGGEAADERGGHAQRTASSTAQRGNHQARGGIRADREQDAMPRFNRRQRRRLGRRQRCQGSHRGMRIGQTASAAAGSPAVAPSQRANAATAAETPTSSVAATTASRPQRATHARTRDDIGAWD